MDKSQSLTLFTNMYLVAMADGKIVNEEVTFLYELAQKMNISKEEMEQVENNAELLGFDVPTDKKGRLAHLESLIEMMMIDGEIHEKEYQLCLNYAYKSGSDQLVVDMLIEKVGQGEELDEE